jgi:predicted ATPase
LLGSRSGSLLLLENPEAHLHPRGQAKLGELLARAASGGVQVIVESHSDHVLNGIRIAVRDGILAAEDAAIHFFARDPDATGVRSKVTQMRVDRDGRIDKWPEGFFDEWDRALEKLLEPRTE